MTTLFHLLAIGHWPRWTKWERHASEYQTRHCETCGLIQTKSSHVL
mgnify:CR=1 FL=1